jgi:hypothetical protein
MLVWLLERQVLLLKSHRTRLKTNLANVLFLEVRQISPHCGPLHTWERKKHADEKTIYTQIDIEGSKVAAQEPGNPVGTRPVQVLTYLHNVPARRKPLV